jgi:hypothetical protein
MGINEWFAGQEAILCIIGVLLPELLPNEVSALDEPY